jgi:two-component system, cell cycle sensor histidine kinase and response regulator CckA
MSTLLFLASGLWAAAAVLVCAGVESARRRLWPGVAAAALAAAGAFASAWSAMEGRAPTTPELVGAACFLAAAALALISALSVNRLAHERSLHEQRAAALDDELRRLSQSTSAQLELSQRRFQEVAQLAPVGIFEADADGRCTWMSRRWAELTGRPREALLGKPWLDFIHPDDRAIVRQHVRQAASGRSFEVDCRYEKGDGTIAWMMVYGVPRRDESGRHAGLVGTLTDMTEQRGREAARLELDRRMQYVQKFESLGVMAGGIAHDFNNLLTGVLGGVDVVRERLAAHKPVDEVLENMRTAATQGAELARQMLAFSGRGSLVFESLLPADVVDEMLPLIESSLTKTRELEVRLERDTPSIEGDINQLRHVVFNLVGNACEATKSAGGKISISVSMVRADRSLLASMYIDDNLPEGEYAVLEIADNGSGIEPKHLRRIFEPFFSTKFTGRGLGLAVVLGIVRGHRGGIAVESEIGTGTTVRVYLPVQRDRTPVRGRIEVPRRRVERGGTVLVVDDEPIVRAIARQMLEPAGYSVIEAADGEAGCEVVRRGTPRVDVVLVDLVMPRKGGIEALHEMQSLRGDLGSILTSGYAESDLRAELAGSRAGFVQKPFSSETLLAAVDAAFTGARGAGERSPST